MRACVRACVPAVTAATNIYYSSYCMFRFTEAPPPYTRAAYDYPFYGVQWHPEKNGFEWTPHEDIPHTEPAVAVMQGLANFFVQEGRQCT